MSDAPPEAKPALGLPHPGDNLVPASMQKRPGKHLRARAAVDAEVRGETDLGVAEVRCRPRPVPAQMVAVWWLLLERSFHLAENKKP